MGETMRHYFSCGIIILTMVISLLACERRSAELSLCVSNLHDIEYCKHQWASDNGKSSDAVPTWADLRPYFVPRWSNNIPVCPAGGTYTIGSMGEDPTCSIGGKGHAIR